MNERDKYGFLINQNAKLHRQYFREMCKLIGIHVLYRACKKGKSYEFYTNIDSDYEEPILVGCIFREHPDQYTLKKLGWVSELQTGASLIEVDYDLPNLQEGCLFIIPSGIDDGKGRIFRVTKMSSSMVFPSSIVCEIIPEYKNTYDPSSAYDYENHNFTLIEEEQESGPFA